jgi:hypothetical protein
MSTPDEDTLVKSRRILVVSLKGGLGNQISGTLTAISLMKRNGLLLIDLNGIDHNLTSTGRPSSLRDFALKAPNNVRIRFMGKFSSKFKRILLRCDFLWVVQCVVRKYHLDGPQIGAQPARDLISRGEILEITMRNPSPNFEKLFNEITRCESVSIGVHIRLGDFKSWHEGQYLMTSDYFQKVLNSLDVSLPNKIFVFSDEPHEVAKYLPELDFCVVSQGNSLSPAEELILFSKCDFLVCSWSSFSWCAGYIAAPHSTILFPDSDWKLPGWRDSSHFNS